MADNASIARPYAKAIFGLAEETGAHEAWEAALARLSAVSADQDFAGLVNDPSIDTARLATLMVELAGDSLPEGGANFISLLAQNDRVEALASIHTQYTELVSKAKARVNAEVITAMPLSDEQRASIASALEHRLGLEVELDETVNADLIGGAVIRAGDLVIDGSAKGRIEKLNSALLR